MHGPLALTQTITIPPLVNPLPVEAASPFGFNFQPYFPGTCSFDTSGTWAFDRSSGNVGPNGSTIFNSNSLLPSAPLGALLVKRSSGAYEFAGAHIQLNFGTYEYVYFLINDIPGAYSDNSGIISVGWTCSDITSQPALAVSFTGAAGGTILSSDRTINCINTAGVTSGTCLTSSYPLGAEVILEATPSPDSRFSRWYGCDAVTGSNSSQCLIRLFSYREVKAEFIAGSALLEVALSGTGTGKISSNDNKINCTRQQVGQGTFNTSGDCSASFPTGAQVALTVVPAAGSRFTNWTNCDTANDAAVCTMKMNGDKRVEARLDGAPDPTSPPAFSVDGAGHSNSLTKHAVINTPFTYKLVVTGTPDPVLSVGAGSQFPPRITFDVATSTFSGTPPRWVCTPARLSLPTAQAQQR